MPDARAVLAHRGLELAVGEVLDAQVDAGDEVLALRGALQHLDVLDHAAAAVLDHALRAVDARERAVVGELEPLLAASSRLVKPSRWPVTSPFG